MAAAELVQHGVDVVVHDAMPSMGRKLLLAGASGLNLTRAEPFDQFAAHYGLRRQHLEPLLRRFGPDDVQAWAHALGIETFVGSSRRVFPVGMNAQPLLGAWLARLEQAGVCFQAHHRWGGALRIPAERAGLVELDLDTPEGPAVVSGNAVVLALGGGSWSRLGSDGAWVSWLERAGVPVAPLKPANCGFDVAWSSHFRERYEGEPIKTVTLSFASFRQRGDCVVTRHGLQGGLIYAAAAPIRDALDTGHDAVISLDLAPDRSSAWLIDQLSRARGSRSIAHHLQKTVGLMGIKVGLLYEFMPREQMTDPERLAAFIKELPVPLRAPRPLDEAISSAGGVVFDALDDNLMIERLPGVFCAGEMLDWEAPTGGYLLTACLSSGVAAGRGVIRWLNKVCSNEPVGC